MSNTPDDIAASHYRASFLQPLFQTLQGSGILVLSGCLIERQDEDVYRAKQLPGRCIREPEFRQGIERDRGHRLRGGFIPVGIRPDLIEVITRLGQRNLINPAVRPGNEVIKEGILRFTEDVKQTTLLRKKPYAPGLQRLPTSC